MRPTALAVLLIAFAAAPAGAQGDDPAAATMAVPRLRPTASSAAGFVPPGWAVEAQASGDLDGDARADRVMVLRPASARKGRTRSVGPHPHLLVVVVAGGPGRPWRLAARNGTLIPPRDASDFEDPVDPADALAVRDGTFRVALRFFADAIWSPAFTFRLRDGRFDLVRYTMESRHRFTAATEAVDADYAAGTLRIETGVDGDEKPLEAETRNLPRAPRPSLDTLGSALEFRPLRD